MRGMSGQRHKESTPMADAHIDPPPGRLEQRRLSKPGRTIPLRRSEGNGGMFKRVMVPLDGSPHAQRALAIAGRVARASQGSVVLVYVSRLGLGYSASLGLLPIAQSAIDEEYRQMRAYLASIAASETLAGVATETLLLSGPVAESLVSAIARQHIDLVVLNSHGRSGVARWMLGSVAEQLAHVARVPLLVLREPADTAEPTASSGDGGWEAVVGLDGSPLAEEALEPAIALLEALAGPHHTALHAVRVISDASDADKLAPELGDAAEIAAAHERLEASAADYLRALTDRLRSRHAGLQVNWAVVQGRDVAATLIDWAGHTATAAHAASGGTSTLMAMATHGRSGLARWTMGSVTVRVLEGGRLPLLVVRPTEITRQQESGATNVLPHR
jgi:nucleotide-binding universal stress UspA family protein